MKNFIDKKLFPAVITYAVDRWHIVFLLCLGVVLMTFQKPIVELVGGNYTNVVSATVALLILREEIHQKKLNFFYKLPQYQNTYKPIENYGK